MQMTDHINHVNYHSKSHSDPSQSPRLVINGGYINDLLTKGLLWECVTWLLRLPDISLMMEPSPFNEVVEWWCVSEQVWPRHWAVANHRQGINGSIAMRSDGRPPLNVLVLNVVGRMTSLSLPAGPLLPHSNGMLGGFYSINCYFGPDQRSPLNGLQWERPCNPKHSAIPGFDSNATQIGRSLHFSREIGNMYSIDWLKKKLMLATPRQCNQLTSVFQVGWLDGWASLALTLLSVWPQLSLSILLPVTCLQQTINKHLEAIQ